MAKKTAPLLPGTELRLQHLGERLRLARLRRRLTGKQVAERAGMTPVTLRSLEKGSSGVTIGAYLAVMQVLGAEKDLDLLLKDDPLGRNLQDAALPQRSRAKTEVMPPAPKRRASSSARAAKVEESTIPSHWTADDTFVSSNSLASLIKAPQSDKKGPGK
jgi:transcriptional regulator with XRE-family HTH domain